MTQPLNEQQQPPVYQRNTRETSTTVQRRNRDLGLVVWFTGLSGSGKTTLSQAVFSELASLGLPVQVLDGDVIRQNLWNDLGFSRADRDENVRRLCFIANLLMIHGIVVLVSAISPYRQARDEARHQLKKFIEVHVDASLETCEARDPRGLYRRARSGILPNFTGISDVYEAPLQPELRCNTERFTVMEISNLITSKIVEYVRERELNEG